MSTDTDTNPETPTSADPKGDPKPSETAVKAEQPMKKIKSEDLLDRFLRLSGYDAADVDSHNVQRRTFATTNGGKYQLTKNGVRRLSGPSMPKEQESE